MAEYYIPTGDGEAEFVEKRSRFLGHVRLVETEEDGKAFITQMKKKYHDARHNCWCYIIKDGAERYSDDGEPQGTAGQPMLGVFQKEGVVNVCCVVTRYFGGILLGAGGLVRAYTQSAKDALDAAGISMMAAWKTLELGCAYSQYERIKRLLNEHEAVIEDTDFGAEVLFRALVREDRAEDFSAALTEMTAGGVSARFTGECFRGVRIK